MKTALWPGFNLRRCCHVVLVLSTVSVWLALADILQQGIRQTACRLVKVEAFLSFFFFHRQTTRLPPSSLLPHPPFSPSSSSTWAPFHPDEIATRLRSHIDLTVVSNHWGSSLFSPPRPLAPPHLVLFAEQGDGSLCQHQAFLLLIDVDLIKIPAFLKDLCAAKPEEDLISKSFFCTYSQYCAEEPHLCCCTDVWTLLPS